MSVLNQDVQDAMTIREVRTLCLKKQFNAARALANTLNDEQSRKTLINICNSFKQSNIMREVA